jgi:hypothetical protein
LDRPGQARVNQVISAAYMGLKGGEAQVDHSKADLSLRAALRRASPALQEMEGKAAMFDQLTGAIKGKKLTKDERALKRVMVDQLVTGVKSGDFSQREVSRMTGVHRATIAASIRKERFDVGQSLHGWLQRMVSELKSLLGLRQKRSDALGTTVKVAVREFVHCYSKFEEKTFVCLLTKHDVWIQYCKFHDRNGLYFPQGSPDHLDYEEKLLNHVEGPLPSPARPMSESSWMRLWPKEVTKDVWRSCCCTQCAEVEDLLDTWGSATRFCVSLIVFCRKMMTVSHAEMLGNEKHARGDLSRQFSARCTSAACPWTLPEEDSNALRVPVPFPARFKNKLCSESLHEDLGVRCPKLFCSPCGCGACEIERKKQGLHHPSIRREMRNGIPAWKCCR